MRVISRSRRDSIAAAFTFLAVASLAPAGAAAAISMRAGFRSALCIAALVGYTYFAGQAVRLWQGRRCPSLRRSAWRRHFLPRENRAPSASRKSRLAVPGRRSAWR